MSADARRTPARLSLARLTPLRDAAFWMALLFLALHLPSLPASLEDLDSINFALGIRHFDVVHHQPHPPGYPLFVLAAKGAHALVVPEATALGLVGVVSGALGAFALVVLFRRMDDEPGWRPYLATLVTMTAPLYWFTAARPLSDTTGLAAALGVQALTLSAFTPGAAIRAAACAGFAIGLRSQVAWLTLPLLAFTIIRRSGRDLRTSTLARAAAACFAGGLAWAIPLVWLSGGPAAYWHALSNQGAEDFGGVTMLWTMPTPRELAEALYYAFVAPWAIWPLAGVVLVFAIAGAVRLWRRRASALVTLAWAFLPYLMFDLLFQETFTTRYALPLVAPIAYLAVHGLAALPSRQAVALAAGLAACNLAVGAPQLWSYSRAEAPAFRMLADMRDPTPSSQRGAKASAERSADAFALQRQPVVAMHRREALDLRRPIQWVGAAMPRVAATLPAPPKHEWLELVKYWNGGGRNPVWFVADPLRSDLALVDHAEAPLRSYDWTLTLPVLLGGVRPSAMDWYRLDDPGWYLGEGWALTPETAGVAGEDHRGPGVAPIVGWIRRRAEAAVLMYGGRNMTPKTSHVRVSLDGRAIDDRDVAPGSFLQMIDLPAGTLDGDGPHARLTVAADSDRTAIEQFDAQSTGHVVFGYGEGWHEHEYDPSTGAQWRWTSERAALHIRAEGHALTLVLRGVTERSGISHIVVRVGDRILARESVGATLALSIGIPAAIVSARDTILTIESDQTHVPAERSRRSPDRRRLGLRVFECRVTPAS
ncbi:MAG TPA: hypothetical protein VHU82_04395 [Vicinamibacterales bacterium]|nr:hypothetical protein [Vicinamibacterales bacterium]